jgi:hypothetical protein
VTTFCPITRPWGGNSGLSQIKFANACPCIISAQSVPPSFTGGRVGPGGSAGPAGLLIFEYAIVCIYKYIFRHPGLADVVDLEWLKMFNYHEHQIIISGALLPVDISDLRSHTNYSGGYTDEHPVIQNFWNVVSFNFV